MFSLKRIGSSINSISNRHITLKKLLNQAKNKNGHDFSFSKLSSTYKGLTLHKYGEELHIEDCKRKKLKSNQARIAVHSAAVNASDLLMVENKYDREIKLPFIPGVEICGEILELADDVKSLSIGQKIIGLSKAHFGGFAEECVLEETDIWNVNMDVSFEHGASLAENYAVALIGLNRRAKIKEGSVVLVTAAAGGLGLAAVDLASNVYKAKVIGVCGTEDKADLVREKGAWAALKYHPKHLLSKVQEVTEGRGVDVVFDAVGGEVFNNALDCVGPEGGVIVAGFASRVIPHIETSRLLPKAISLYGISLTNYRTINHDVYRQSVTDVIDMHEERLISPHVSASFKLENIAEAFKFIRERRSTGKVVLDVR